MAIDAKEIRADVDALRADGKKIKELSDTSKIVSKEVTKLKEDLSQGWQGTSGKLVDEILGIWIKQQNEISRELEKIGKTVANYANSIDTTDQGLAKLIREHSSGGGRKG